MDLLKSPSALDKHFDTKISRINCREETKAYIKSIFFEFLKTDKDMLNKSITFQFYKAKTERDFIRYRNIGDWLFWSKTMYPDSLSDASPDYYSSIARTSYHKCHIILNRQWILFEELADRFDDFVQHIICH